MFVRDEYEAAQLRARDILAGAQFLVPTPLSFRLYQIERQDACWASFAFFGSGLRRAKAHVGSVTDWAIARVIGHMHEHDYVQPDDGAPETIQILRRAIYDVRQFDRVLPWPSYGFRNWAVLVASRAWVALGDALEDDDSSESTWLRGITGGPVPRTSAFLLDFFGLQEDEWRCIWLQGDLVSAMCGSWGPGALLLLEMEVEGSGLSHIQVSSPLLEELVLYGADDRR